MVLFRALGWLLLALGAGVVVHDGLSWWSEGVFRMLDMGGLWSRLDLGSLRAVQAGLQDVLSGVLWTGLVLPILGIPALVAFVAGGVVCLWLGGRTGDRSVEASFIGMSRPRRRRSRGLS
ncbi:MAG: hypothetical protein KIS73_10630 [Enhydrobacter sp.]|nr:hypothetical protein [Enhydrobacter sp.]